MTVDYNKAIYEALKEREERRQERNDMIYLLGSGFVVGLLTGAMTVGIIYSAITGQ